MATVTENSDDTSSCCFPPKASTLDVVNTSSSQLQLNKEDEKITYQVWEGSCSDRKAPGRHPLIDTTNKGVQNNNTNTQQHYNSVFAVPSSKEPLLGSGRSNSSSSGASEGGASHDPFTPSQSYASSETMLPAGSGLMLGGSSVTTNTNVSSLEQTLDQHVPQLMRLIHEEEDDDAAPAVQQPKQQAQCGGGAAAPVAQPMGLRRNNHSSTHTSSSAATSVAQPMGVRRNNHQSTSASKKGVNPNAPQFTLSYSASPFVPKGSNGKHSSKAEEQVPPATPPSNASCFSVTSYNGDGSELPVDCQDTKQLQKAGCEFIPAPLSITKADPVISRPLPGEPLSAVKEVFVGQLPFDFNPAALCEALGRLVNAADASQIFTRFKMGPKPTCAFLTVKEPFATDMLELTKKILCDNNGMWVARSFEAEQGLNHVSKRRMTLKKPGIPQKPMVLESVNQASHAAPAGGPGGKGHNSSNQSRVPPIYHPHGNPNGGQFHPHQQQRALGGAFVPPGGAMPMGGGFIPPMGTFHPQQQQQQFGGGTGYSYEQPNFAQQQNNFSSPPSNNKQQQPQMSVCLCGAQHGVAMLNAPSTCTMCALPLPTGVMVRQCQKCPDSDICTRCVAMANKAMQQQQSGSGRNSETGSNHSH